ncbi:MAG: UDP-3-O-(3-hydroxymyristoyl)glucosamine N-acyltransferase [bacterium]
MTYLEPTKKLTLKEIADLVDGRLEGNGNIIIKGASGIREARQNDITFVHLKKYLKYLADSKASAVVLKEGWDNASIPAIFVEDPYFAFALIIKTFYTLGYYSQKGCSDKAVISDKASISEGVSVQPYAIIEIGADIGERTVIGANSYIGKNVKIGDDCFIHPNVTIRENVIIGNRVIIHSGSVIGSDGFGYAFKNGKFHKIPQIGTVIIGDDVEIGACCTIDRATMSATKIGDGTKIDNLVQIAHNVEIGKNCAVAAQVGIMGSTIINDNVMIGGQAGIIGHLTIGSGSQIAAQSGVAKDIPPMTKWLGSPARPLMEAKRIEAFLSKYDKILDKLRRLEGEIKEIKRKQKL